MNTNERFLSKHGSKILLGILIVFAVVSNFVWIHSDTRLGIDSDSKDYIIRTITQLDKLQSKGWLPANWLNGLSHGGRPPLYQILSMPFILLFGRSMDSGLMINLVFQALLIVLVYLIGNMVSNSRTGLLAALFVASYPPLLQMSRIYRPHFALTACVALCLWRVFALLRNRLPRNVWWFVLSLAFGILIHPKIIGVVLIPVPIFSLYVVFFQDEPRTPGSMKELPKWMWAKLSDRIVWAGFLPAIILAAIPIFAWYLTLGNSVFGTFERISSDELADFRGFEIYKRGFMDYPPYLWYLLSMPYALSNVLTLLFGAGLIYSVLKRDINHIVLLVSFIGAYIVHASYKTLVWMNFAPILPIMALISATWIGEVKNKKIAWGATSLAVISSLCIFSIVTWGVSGIGVKIAQALSSPVGENGQCQLGNRVFCPNPAERNDWRTSEILAAVEKDISQDCLENKCDLLVIQRSSEFWVGNFKYFILVQNSSIESKINIHQMPIPLFVIASFDYNLLLNSTYTIYVTPPRKVDQKVIYEFDRIANDFLANPPPSFANAHQHLAVFNIHDGMQIQVIKRIRPLSVVEAEDTIHAIDIEEKYKYQQYAVLAPLYAEEGDLVTAISYYTQALKYTQDTQTRVEYLLKLGRMYLSMGRTEEAISAYKDALKLKPGDPRTHLRLAWSYTALGETDLAIQEFQKVIQYAPESKFAQQAQEWLDQHK